MLLDKDGISPHTVNEVFLNNKWCVFDPSNHTIFRDKNANMLSLDEISDNPDLIYNDRTLIALKEYDKNAYDSFVVWFSRMFPMPASPRRSTPAMLQSHIFDHITDMYFKKFKYNFFNLYQDLYLKLKKNYSHKIDFKLFFMARNYHLSYRKDLALEYYNQLLKEYPKSAYQEDAIFFCGMLYYEIRDFSKSADSFELILEKYPSKWKAPADYYLGKM